MLKFSATKMSVAEIKITAGIYVGIYIKNIHASYKNCVPYLFT